MVIYSFLALGLYGGVEWDFSTTAISTVFGTALALAVARFRFRLAGFYRIILLVPMIMPEIDLGIALLILFVTVAGIGLYLKSRQK